MITTVQTLIEVKEAISNILTQAGFADGAIRFVNDKPMFWFINVVDKGASEKDTYLTYNIVSISSVSFGEGKPNVKQATIEVALFSRDKNVDNYLTNLNNAFEMHGWMFELNRIDFDTTNKLYIYTFTTRCEVS